MSFVLAFVISAALTGSLLWAVARWTGFAMPVVDLLLVVGLCNALALLPRAGWFLAMLILSLLLLKTTEADAWPDSVLIVAGSGIVWVVVNMALFALWS
jgi:hypothetical protein